MRGREQRSGRISRKGKVNSEADRLYRLINHSDCFFFTVFFLLFKVLWDNSHLFQTKKKGRGGR